MKITFETTIDIDKYGVVTCKEHITFDKNANKNLDKVKDALIKTSNVDLRSSAVIIDIINDLNSKTTAT